jgi:hypothetical protein
VPRTQLVLDLPKPAGLRVVIVDRPAVVDECLAMVLRHFGVLVTSGPAAAGEPAGDMATPHVRLSEIVEPQTPAAASVQRLAAPGGVQIAFQRRCGGPREAVVLALSLAARDPLVN